MTSTLSVAAMKSHFSEVLKEIEKGHEFVIAYGRRKEKVAAIVPFRTYARGKKKRRLGVLKGKASFKMARDFEMTTEEFLGL